MIKLCESMMLCCMSSPQVKQVQLAAQYRGVDITLIDDAMRIVLQHLPDVAAVCPVSLVCRSVVNMASRHHTHRHIKHLEQINVSHCFQYVEQLLRRPCVTL